VKNPNLLANAADVAGLALRSLAPTSARHLGGALSTLSSATDVASAPPGS